MITETAKVVAVENDEITVEAAIKSTCSSCQAQSDCGTGAVSRAMAPKVQHLTLRSPMPVRVGDTVKIGIPEAGILSASVWLYLMPLLIFIGCALLLSELLPLVGLISELWVLLGCIIFTFAGFVWISGRIKKADNARFQPVILSTTASSPASTTSAS